LANNIKTKKTAIKITILSLETFRRPVLPSGKLNSVGLMMKLASRMLLRS
jgi:hypothetical protein